MNNIKMLSVILILRSVGCVPSNYFQLGYYANREGRFDDAIRYYTLYLKDHPDDAEAYNNRALAYFCKNEYNHAIQDCNKAIELKPDMAYAYNLAGAAYSERREYKLAMKYFDKAIEYKPDLVEAYAGRGWAYVFQPAYDRAIHDLTQAINLRPNSPDLYDRRAMIYYCSGQNELAIADYTTSLELGPRNTVAYHNRAVAYYSIGDYVNAKKDCEIGLKMNDGDLRYSLLALKCFCEAKFEKAIEYYTKAINRYPEAVGCHSRRGDVYYKLGMIEEAKADWRKAHELNPAYPIAKYAREVIEVD